MATTPAGDSKKPASRKKVKKTSAKSTGKSATKAGGSSLGTKKKRRKASGVVDPDAKAKIDARTVDRIEALGGLATEGLFRLPGSSEVVSELLEKVSAAGSNRAAGATASTERPKAVHSSIDMSKSQRLPDMREFSKSASREQRNEQAKIEENSAKSGSGPVSKSPTKSQVKNSGSSGGAKSPVSFGGLRLGARACFAAGSGA